MSVSLASSIPSFVPATEVVKANTVKFEAAPALDASTLVAQADVAQDAAPAVVEANLPRASLPLEQRV